VSFNFITIIAELNQINVLTFTGNPFLTSEFEITHILFFSLKLRHFYMNRWILICGDSVIGIHVTKTFTNFGEKKPNRFQVIAFCFKRNNKSCYVTHVNFSSSTLFKEVGKCFFIDFIDIHFTESFSIFYSDSGDINGIFVGLTVVRTQTEMFVCIRHFQKV